VSSSREAFWRGGLSNARSPGGNAARRRLPPPITRTPSLSGTRSSPPMSLAAASSALRQYQIDLHCAGLPLKRNIHSLPQPAGPVKVANGGHLSGTKMQVAGYDKNSWLRLGNLREQAALWLRLTAR